MTRVLNWKLSAAGIVGAILAAMILAPSGADAHHLADAGLELPALEDVTSGWMHSCGRTADGEVYCWGNNATGNLGDGTAANVRPLAKRVDGFDSAVAQVSAGADHTCALTELQDIWCWGGNLSGQLGVGAYLGTVRRTPGKVTQFETWDETDPKFVQLTAGNTVTCGLDTEGIPWCWGSDLHGQLGRRLGNIAASGDPGRVRTDLGMGPVKTVRAGASHVCALNLRDELWCWGNNTDGRLGDGTMVSRSVPVRVMLANGFPDGGVTDFSLGTYHTCATTGNGHVYCWGDNGYGRLGNPDATSTTKPVQVRKYRDIATTDEFTGLIGVSAGLDHTCAWTAEGQGWCWGRSLYGQLGDGIVASNQAVPRYPVRTWTTLMEPTGKISHIAAGYNHTCSRNEGGKAYCWGHNGLGQNGDGTFVFHKEPAKVFQLQAPI